MEAVSEGQAVRRRCRCGEPRTRCRGCSRFTCVPCDGSWVFNEQLERIAVRCHDCATLDYLHEDARCGAEHLRECCEPECGHCHVAREQVDVLRQELEDER